MRQSSTNFSSVSETKIIYRYKATRIARICISHDENPVTITVSIDT